MRIDVRTIHTDVLIVGAGPVGSALAVELGLHGIRTLLIERRTGVSPQPRAKLTNVRTMALLRRWGIADAVRAAAPLPPSFPSDVAFVTRLTGWELTRFPNALSTVLDRGAPFPEPAQQVPQEVVESVLRDRARRFATVTLTEGVTLETFDELPTEVVATARATHGGRPIRIRARYLAGCDGARSLVRELLGIQMTGETLAANVSAVLRAPDLWSRHDKAPAVHYWTVTPDAPGILGPLDATERWWYHLNEVRANRTLTDDEVRASFYAAVGTTFPCEVVDQGPWLAERRIADRYRSRRVFLLGDAAHLHPPMGGYGMNMGIGDAVDLGWKLAAALQGWGGPRLLASYELERRPVHVRVINEASRNFAHNSNRYHEAALEEDGAPGRELRRVLGATIREEKAREWATIGVQLGYRYERSPIVLPDGTAPTPEEVDRYFPTARPGHLAPHAWLDGSRCLFDLLGPALTLLQLGGNPATARPLLAAATARRVPLTSVRLTSPELRELYGADLILIRPDQHVAWRGNSAEDAQTILDRASGADRAPHPATSP